MQPFPSASQLPLQKGEIQAMNDAITRRRQNNWKASQKPNEKEKEKKKEEKNKMRSVQSKVIAGTARDRTTEVGAWPRGAAHTALVEHSTKGAMGLEPGC